MNRIHSYRSATLLGIAITGGLLLQAAGFTQAATPKFAPTVQKQISALIAEKEGRTPSQRKIDSQLLLHAKKKAGGAAAADFASIRTNVKTDAQQRVLVDIQATVSDNLLAAITKAGGTIVSQVPQFDAIRAQISTGLVETLAARPDVKSINSAVEFTTDVGTLTTQGDRTHAANTARSTYGATGAGVKVGVLSDGVDSLAASITSGDLRATTSVIPGQAGSGDEGTAMLEIVQDIAPNADLIYATAGGGLANFAANILALQAAGCKVIVDDVGYASENPFQDDVLSQAINTVSAAGVMYFATARNAGNKNDNTSGTWEGDFANGGAAAGVLAGTGTLHDFGGSVTQNVVVAGGSQYRADLFWSDPAGASGNDYDLYVLNAAGTAIVAQSTNIQDGNDDPYENVGTLNVGERIVIIQKIGAANRFLHLDTGRGRITVNTAGRTRGHHACGAANAFGVAATNVANSPSPTIFVGGATNPVETFSSDGPRRVFYLPNGTAITPGNFSSTGGTVRNKPDITAADGGVTTVPGFNPFFGTSAAAPHAAAIAALLRSYNPAATPAQIRAALTSTALDIEAAGPDRDSGAGIIMAQAAMAALTPPSPLSIASSTGGQLASGEQAGNAAGAAGIGTWDTLRTGAVLSAEGSIGFRANLLVGSGAPPVTNQDFQGIWKDNGVTTALKSRTGSVAPGTGGAVWDQLGFNPWISSNGLVSFSGVLRSGTGAPAVTGNTDGGVWTEHGGLGVQLLIRENDAVPGVAGFVVDSVPSTIASSPLGNTAFSLRARNGAARTTAIIRADVAGAVVTPALVAVQGGAAPAVGGGTLGTFYVLNGNFSEPRMNDAGNIAFAATLNIGGGVTGANDTQGVWYQTNAAGAVTALARAGATAPGTSGAKFIAFERPTIADGGFVAFRGFIDNTGDNGAGNKSQGIWSTPNGTSAGLTPVIRTGDTGISGMPVGSTVGSVWSPFSSKAGKIAFRATIIDGGIEKRAIFTNNTGAMKMLFMEGSTTPSLAETFVNFDHPVISDAGHVAFTASTSGGKYGIWKEITANNGVLILLSKVGDTVATAQGNKVISSILVPGTTTDDRKYEQDVIDTAGEMLVFVTYADASQGILLSP